MLKIKENDLIWVLDDGAEYCPFVSKEPRTAPNREQQHQAVKDFLRKNGIDPNLAAEEGVRFSHTFKLIKIIKDNPIFDFYTYDQECLRGQFALIRDIQDNAYHLFGLKENFKDFRKINENTLW